MNDEIHKKLTPLVELLTSIDETELAMRELVEETKAEIAAMKLRFQSVIQRIVENETNEARMELATYLLLRYRSVPIKVIAHAFGFVGSSPGQDLKRWLGKIELNWTCEGCGNRLVVQSRSELESLIKKSERERTAPEGFYNLDSLLCKECEGRLEKERRDRFLAHDRKIEAERAWRLAVLQKLPYKEYLQTEEWKEVRAAAMKRAWYRCQVCNTNQTKLDVHHRTYERRGEERPSDVIVLCRDCHGTFHKQGKLAN